MIDEIKKKNQSNQTGVSFFVYKTKTFPNKKLRSAIFNQH